MPTQQSWGEWYLTLLDSLQAAIVAANVQWETSAEGEPWVILGQRRPKGVDYPHAMVMQFTKSLQPGSSMRSNELHDVQIEIANFRLDDAREPQKNLRNTIRDMGAIEDELYSDRSLGGACEKLTITQSNAFGLESANGHESVGHIQVGVDKHAEIGNR